ncbi:restriction endonuclease subunit S [Halalkalibaculum sp. DA3122]|uniref:restriction endonuclease subunit S n=1 Tax=Halalkalibaculum sp. DA3122 TaxID=3373607 RepID=UPI003754546B
MDNWGKTDLGSVIKLVSGRHIKSAKCNKAGNGLKYLTGPTDFVGNQIQATKFTEEPKSVAEPGDILLTVKGSGVGKLAFSDDRYCISRQLMALRPKKIETEFLFYYLQNNREYFERYARGLIPGISRDEVTNFVIKIPPKEERKQIVEIINEWQRGIQKLKKLIKTKKRYKKGLMQQLLSGKKRFPEFEDESWQEVELGKVFQRVTQKNEDEEVTNVLTISAQDGLVSQTDYYDKSVASKDLSRYIVLQEGDLAYNKSYSDGYPLGAIKRLEEYEKGVLSPLYICFRIDSPKLDSDFMTHFFENGGLDHDIYKIAREGARNHGLLNVSIKDFFKIRFKVPQIEEQKKIAKVLNKAKKEIELLEEELDAVKKQKKGLMQQLLTGKTRVTNGTRP